MDAYVVVRWHGGFVLFNRRLARPVCPAMPDEQGVQQRTVAQGFDNRMDICDAIEAEEAE